MGVSRNAIREVRGAVLKMGEGLPRSAFQEQVSNHRVRLCSKGMVVSDSKKAFDQERQVSIQKVSASEPLMKRRKGRSVAAKTGEFPSSPGSVCEKPELLRRWRPAYRRHELDAGFGTEREKLIPPMLREMTSG
jgi:hypothetical protein